MLYQHQLALLPRVQVSVVATQMLISFKIIYHWLSHCTDLCNNNISGFTILGGQPGIKVYQGAGTGKGTCACGSTFQGDCTATCLSDFCLENCGDSTVTSSQCSATPTAPVAAPVPAPAPAPVSSPTPNVPNCPNSTGSGQCQCNNGSIIQSFSMTLSKCTSHCSGANNGIWLYQGPGSGQGSCACGSTFQGSCDSTCLGEFCLANCGDATISTNQCSTSVFSPTAPSPVQAPSPSYTPPSSSTCPTATSSGQCRCFDGAVLQSSVSVPVCTSFCANHGGIITYQGDSTTSSSSGQAICTCGSTYQGACNDACFESFCNENCGNPSVSIRQCSGKIITSAASGFHKMTSAVVIGYTMGMIIIGQIF